MDLGDHVRPVLPIFVHCSMQTNVNARTQTHSTRTDREIKKRIYYLISNFRNQEIILIRDNKRKHTIFYAQNIEQTRINVQKKEHTNKMKYTIKSIPPRSLRGSRTSFLLHWDYCYYSTVATYYIQNKANAFHTHHTFNVCVRSCVVFSQIEIYTRIFIYLTSSFHSFI